MFQKPRLPSWLIALAIFTLACQADAAPHGKPAYSSDQGLVVHEWGTFSTFSGSDGVNLKFAPYDNDLPEFVHGYLSRDSKAGPLGGTISLETPVLYFYSTRPLTASAVVDFPKGTLTEWYPQAARTKTRLAWKDIHVARNDDVKLLAEPRQSRYYAARATDALPLTVEFFKDNATRTEAEKFLFYRGVGTFDMPLSARALGDTKFSVTWKGKVPQDDMIFVQVKAGKLRFRTFQFQKHGEMEAQAEVQLPTAEATLEDLGETLVKRLRNKGLYEKEARAMIATWRSAWFGEEGSRVLYLLPGQWTESLLPLQVTPKPAARVRVLVGRHDVLTPAREKQIDTWFARLSRPNAKEDAESGAARRGFTDLGRYREAAWHLAQTRAEIRAKASR